MPTSTATALNSCASEREHSSDLRPEPDQRCKSCVSCGEQRVVWKSKRRRSQETSQTHPIPSNSPFDHRCSLLGVSVVASHLSASGGVMWPHSTVFRRRSWWGISRCSVALWRTQPQRPQKTEQGAAGSFPSPLLGPDRSPRLSPVEIYPAPDRCPCARTRLSPAPSSAPRWPG
jgi:hypothetical protein